MAAQPDSQRALQPPAAPERRLVKNTLNVYADQWQRLDEIQAYRYRHTGKKPQLQQMIQEALDDYIAKWQRYMEQGILGP